MKTLKRVSAVLFIFAMMIGFMPAKDAGAKAVNPKTGLVGTWDVIASVDKGTDEVVPIEGLTMTFSKDGKYTTIADESEATFTYTVKYDKKIKNAKITIKDDTSKQTYSVVVDDDIAVMGINGESGGSLILRKVK